MYIKSSPPWTATLDVSQLDPGEHTITVIAVNPGGSGYDDVNVLVTAQMQPPMVTISSPSHGAKVSGVVTIQADVQGQEIQKVEFYVDNKLLATLTAPPWRHTLDTSTIGVGTHTIKVVAYNPSGNTQATVTIEVQEAGGQPSKCVIATAVWE